MQLTAREIELLLVWKRRLKYDSIRLSKSTVKSKVNIRRKAVNNERIKMIDKIVKEVNDGEASKE